MTSSENETRWKPSFRDHPATWVVLITLGSVSYSAFSSSSVLTHTPPVAAALDQESGGPSGAGRGIITGVIVNERQEPVARAQVQAFSGGTSVPAAQQGQTVPFSTRAGGSTSTDAEGRFRVSGLELGDYLVAAEAVPSLTTGASSQTPIDKTRSSAALVEQFKGEKVSWRQFAIAQEIVARRDSSVLPSLAAWLTHEDRHVRGNVAFVFGGLGDPRGFQVITDILTDQSDRPRGETAGGNWTLRAQIRSDRYYAAHLLGDLRDPRAVPILVPLLKDKEINSIVPWALGQIGHKSAVVPLLEALDEDDPSMRVLAIYGLETLKAKEALPRLTSLLDDHRKSNFGAQVSVAEAARAAIAKLQ
jgi:hypothetical protein